MSNNSQMTGIHGNTSLLCGNDPVYYTNTMGIVVDWVIFFVGLPEVCLACYALLCLLKKDKAAPVFAINLLLSDLIQIGITVVFIISRFFDATFHPFVRARCIARLFVRLGLTSSLGFMLLISAERYLLVSCPVWYRTMNTAKLSILISVCTWIFSLAYSSLDYIFLIHTRFSLLLFSIICLLPAPFLLGFFIATWKALNKSTAMRHEKKNRRRVLGVLSLVLGTYIVLFFPFCFRNLYYALKGDNASDKEDTFRDFSSVLTSALVYLSPLIDALIYIFIRRDIRDTVEAFPCCKKPLTKLREFQDKLTDTSQAETAL
ncbi:formyl peptide receptor-related sequence 4-like [Epinephelus fuscoguttatus]|uniref:formyl peptide receptor-related sequence 4-like n=1 Tax=Epinephelus fuscoguttatus TaxID=293821 RepID=UPI0020D0FE45|nr:formyl peptide receptor-related sequence 4-like [Epinephelus fuscoguttatus]